MRRFFPVRVAQLLSYSDALTKLSIEWPRRSLPRPNRMAVNRLTVLILATKLDWLNSNRWSGSIEKTLSIGEFSIGISNKICKAEQEKGIPFNVTKCVHEFDRAGCANLKDAKSLEYWQFK